MKEIIAQAIFDWFTTSENAPYTYNVDAERLETGADGEFSCNQLAEFIANRLEKEKRL